MASAQNAPTPSAAKRLLSSDTTHAGLQQDGECWIFSHTTLIVWGPRQHPITCKLPYALQGSPRVSLISLQDRLVAILASEDGNIFVWPDTAAQTGNVISERIPAGGVTALSAARDRTGVCAIISTASGRLHRLSSFDRSTVTLQELSAEMLKPKAGMLGRFMDWRGGAGTPDLETVYPITAVQLISTQTDPEAFHLLVLTTTNLQCWQVKAASERFAWMLELSKLVQADASGGGAERRALDMSMAPALKGIPREPKAVILSSTTPSSGFEATISIVTVPSSGHPQVLSHRAVAGIGLSPSRITTNATNDVQLLWHPHSAAHVWTEQGGVRQLHPAGCLAATLSQDNRAWQILDATQGMLEYPVKVSQTRQSGQRTSAPAASNQGLGGAGSESRGAPDRETVARLLEDACSSGQAEHGLSGKLQQLHGFSREDSPVAAFSTTLVNALPKHWGVSRGGTALSDQLRGKQQRHNVLLQILSQSGVLERLDPEVLRVLFENGEKVAAVTALREVENRFLAAHAQQAVVPVQGAIQQAGAAIKLEASTSMMQTREDWEVFYSTPGLSAPAFFPAAQWTATQLAQEYTQLEALSRAALSCLAGSSQQHAWQVQWFAVHVDRSKQAGWPEWVANTPVRGALLQLSRRLVELLPAMQSEAPDKLKDACTLLLQLTTPLLNAFAAAQAAPAASRVLEEGYAAAREELLRPLLQQAMFWCREGDPDGDALLQSVETTAEAHRGYEQLFDIAEFRQDPDCLYRQMLDLQPSAPQAGSMASYVFGRLRSEGRLGELLSLPDQFNEELHAWLAAQGEQPDTLELRWLQDLRIGQLVAAATTLRLLQAKMPAGSALEDAGRLACLSKLATLAAQKPGTQAEAAVQADNAQLALLGAQAELGLRDQGLAAPQALLEAAVRRKEPSTCAFEILAAAGPDFRSSNRAAWEAALQNLVEGYDWQALHAQAKQVSEQEFVQLLAGTPACQMATACYSEHQMEALCLDRRFDAEFPAQEAVQHLQQLASKHCPAAQDDIIAAFNLGCGLQVQ